MNILSSASSFARRGRPQAIEKGLLSFICPDCGNEKGFPIVKGGYYQKPTFSCKCGKEVSGYEGSLERSTDAMARHGERRRLYSSTNNVIEYVCLECLHREYFAIKDIFIDAKITCGNCWAAEEVILEHRKKFRKKVDIEGTAGKRKIRIKDISASGLGAFLEVAPTKLTPILIGQEMDAIFNIKSGKKVTKMEVRAIVRRVSGIKIGLEFIGLDETTEMCKSFNFFLRFK